MEYEIWKKIIIYLIIILKDWKIIIQIIIQMLILSLQYRRDNISKQWGPKCVSLELAIKVLTPGLKYEIWNMKENNYFINI